MLVRLKEKTCRALLVGSNQEFSEDWEIGFTILAGGALGFPQGPNEPLWVVEPGWYVVQDVITNKLYRFEKREFEWLKEEIVLN
jgi:hypothetical protein